MNLLNTLNRKISDKQFISFLAVGVANTGFTYAIFLALSFFVEYRLAYSFSYLIGIVFSYYMNSRFVFDVPVSFSTSLTYPVVYLA